MGRIVVVVESEDFRLALKKALSCHHRVEVCPGPPQAPPLLEPVPDAMVLDLFFPGTDGLAFLAQHQGRLPPVILLLTTLVNTYILQRAEELGVGYVIRKPCPVSAVADRLLDMMRAGVRPGLTPAQARTVRELLRLGFLPESSAFGYLRLGILLFAQDPQQRLSKELYPAIAELCRASPQAVEHALRSAIGQAWTRSDRAVWAERFPHARAAPTNRQFIAALAEFISRPE